MEQHIEIVSYDEGSDIFRVRVMQDQFVFDATIPAFLMPHIARDLCDATEDLPFGLVDQRFTLTL